MRTFKVIRTEDVSGVSGIGVVAEGVVFPSGICVVEWRGENASIDINKNGVESWLKIHGHEGRTKIQFNDEWKVGI